MSDADLNETKHFIEDKIYDAIIDSSRTIVDSNIAVAACIIAGGLPTEGDIRKAIQIFKTVQKI